MNSTPIDSPTQPKSSSFKTVYNPKHITSVQCAEKKITEGAFLTKLKQQDLTESASP